MLKADKAWGFPKPLHSEKMVIHLPPRLYADGKSLTNGRGAYGVCPELCLKTERVITVYDFGTFPTACQRSLFIVVETNPENKQQ